jgi:tricorn protease
MIMRTHLSLLSALVLVLFSASLFAQEQDAARLLRFPHVQGERCAFVRGGDIWTVPLAGGTARRLTSFDEGFELFPRISPDGRWVAFSAEYSGSRQIYVVPYEGGVPRQLTWYPDVGPMPPRGGYDNLPLDWTPDGKKILVRMNRTPYGQRVGRYFLVDPFSEGLEQPLEIPEGGNASFSPEGDRVAYNVISREWRTWKRYSAGRAQDVWIYDLGESKAEKLTDFPGTDQHPMWMSKGRIYFVSDRNGTLNLWCHELGSGQQRAVTAYTDYDVLFPARGKGGLVFERGGRIYHMAEKDESIREIVVKLADDRPYQRPTWREGETRFGSFAPSPSGSAALVEFRGDLFEVPKKDGDARNLTNTPDRRERAPGWSPDGRWLSYLAEAGDDYELFLLDRRTMEERQLTRDTGAWITSHSWSPDGALIACVDKANRLWTVDPKSGVVTVIRQGVEGAPRSVSWFESSWLAWTETGANRLSDVWGSPAAEPAPRQVTSSDWSEDSVAFDPQGRYLYFTSARDFDYGDLDFETRLYAIPIRVDASGPLSETRRDVEEDGLSEVGEDDEPEPEEIVDGPLGVPGLVPGFEFGNRELVIPGPVGGYRGLSATKDGPLFSREGKLRLFDLESRETKEVLDHGGGYVLDAKGERMLVRKGGKLYQVKAKPGQKTNDAMPTEEIRVRVDPRVEWSQMYRDAWRIMRDWFYDPKMHRVDWSAMRAKYEPLLAHMTHRSDLDFLLGELIGELNAGHTYVSSGELPAVDRVRNGALGADFEVVEGYYRIAKIFASENWTSDGRNPLTEGSEKAQVGDFLVAIDGVRIDASTNLYRWLEGKAGRPTRLTLAKSPAADAFSREILVKPVQNETRLRYLDWVARNRALVNELSDGRIGYMHVPNTAVEGHRRFYEGFRRMARVKEAILVDDRYNGGGFIPDRMVQSLGSRVFNFWARREAELYATPRFAFNGPAAMLINGYSSSGGDAFPYYFKKAGLGPLIGQKTWGGLVGYSGSPRLVDGGGLAVPSFAFVNDDGAWDVEAYGVKPDIEVVDDPAKIAAGQEPMIEVAVKHLLAEIEKRAKIKRPAVPDGPNRREMEK